MQCLHSGNSQARANLQLILPKVANFSKHFVAKIKAVKFGVTDVKKHRKKMLNYIDNSGLSYIKQANDEWNRKNNQNLWFLNDVKLLY